MSKDNSNITSNAQLINISTSTRISNNYTQQNYNSKSRDSSLDSSVENTFYLNNCSDL